MLRVMGARRLLKGKSVAVNATNREPDVAGRSIIRQHSDDSYRELVTRLSRESGIATKTREQLSQ